MGGTPHDLPANCSKRQVQIGGRLVALFAAASAFQDVIPGSRYGAAKSLRTKRSKLAKSSVPTGYQRTRIRPDRQELTPSGSTAFPLAAVETLKSGR